MACRAILPNMRVCRNYRMGDTEFCVCHQNMTKEQIGKRWRERYLHSFRYLGLGNRSSFDHCMSYILDGTVKLSQHDISMLPWIRQSHVRLYCELIRLKFCEPMANPRLFGRCVSIFIDGSEDRSWVNTLLYQKISEMFQTDGDTFGIFIWYVLSILQRERYREDQISPLFPLILRLINSPAGIEYAISCPELNDFPKMYKTFDFSDTFLQDFLQGPFTDEIKKLRKEGYTLQKSRMDIYKEELMAKTWHPDRIWRYLEMGYEMDDE